MRYAAAIALWLVLAAAPAFSQGCAMCYTSAHAAGARAQKALNRGVGVLMITTLSMIGGLALLAYRARNGAPGLRDEDTTDPGSSPE